MVENTLMQRWRTEDDELVHVTVRIESDRPLSDSTLGLVSQISRLVTGWQRPDVDAGLTRAAKRLAEVREKLDGQPDTAA